MDEQTLLEGYISIRAALKAHSRPIYSITARRDKWDKGIAWLERTAQQASIPFERVESDTIDALANGTSHGGLIARVGSRHFVDIAEIGKNDPTPFVVMLDGVEDPFNFGQAIRAMYAAGASGLIVRPRNWMSAAGVVARASAGASEWIPTAVAETALDAAEYFRSRGLRIAVADEDKSISIYEADLSGPLFVVIGGEKRGITRSFLDQADLRLRIPYAREFDQSLGTTAAAAILAFEIMRQRKG